MKTGTLKAYPTFILLTLRFLNQNPMRKRGISEGKLKYGPYRDSASLTLRVAIFAELSANETAQPFEMRNFKTR